jgi:Pyruvate/2-oxoacid:ferredoxin oxidoreductase gamma subunit
VEYEVFVAGIGGQGIQLIAKVLAVAATAENRHVMLNGVYGGEMRGGKSLATVVLGDRPLRALPVTARAAAAVVLHSKFWEEPHSRLRPDALIVADSEISDQLSPRQTESLVAVPATRISRDIGNPMVAGMVLLSAFNAMTGLVSQDQLRTAMRQLVPPYRAQHIAANEQAILAGADAVTMLSKRVVLDGGEQRSVA